MKRCPQCRKTYHDAAILCSYDGSPLLDTITNIDSNAETLKTPRNQDTSAELAFSISIAGIKIGDPMEVIEDIDLPRIARDGYGIIKICKWQMSNGNELSATYNSRQNRVIYVEIDWNHKPASADSGLSNFRFGITTLKDIRKALGSNGFSYAQTAFRGTDDKLATFNAFEIKNYPNQIIVFVTSLSISGERKKLLSADNIAEHLKLEAVILADEEYLDEIWGQEKIYDKDSKAIFQELGLK